MKAYDEGFPFRHHYYHLPQMSYSHDVLEGQNLPYISYIWGCQNSPHRLPFNVYPSLSPKAKSPLGTRAAQTPLDSPCPHIIVFDWNGLPIMGLAGAFRKMTAAMPGRVRHQSRTVQHLFA